MNGNNICNITAVWLLKIVIRLGKDYNISRYDKNIDIHTGRCIYARSYIFIC